MDTTNTHTRSPERKRHAPLKAEAVARRIIEQKKSGARKKTVYQIAIEEGYSEESARQGTPQRAKAFKDIMQSYTEELARERERQLRAMTQKDLTKEAYKTLSEASTRATHDLQLLTGGATERMQYEAEAGQLRAIIEGLATMDNRAIHKEIIDVTNEKLDPPASE